MKRSLYIALFGLGVLVSCSKDKEVLNDLNSYTIERQSEGFHFGDSLKLPSSVLKEAKEIKISFGDKETSSLLIDPNYFSLGDNAVTFLITTSSGEVLSQDATINVFAAKPEASISYEIIKEYPHDPANFTQGFQLEGQTLYESDGQHGLSQLIKYTLGSTAVQKSIHQPQEVFSEGATIVGDKIYQLTWQNKKGFVYDKSSLELLSEFPYPNVIGEGWGLTYDGKNLIASDGTKNLYFLSVEDPSQVVRSISVAGNTQAYDQLNELEYHKGYIYANVWQNPIVLKIDPKSGEVVGKFDFTQLARKHTKGNDDVLNGIAFKGDNMLVTGKNWPTIYEVQIK